MKLLGIDYGTKRIGLAVSNDGGNIAFPDQVIQNDSRILDIIALLVHEKEISKIVIGESKNYKMQDNEIMEEIRDFAQVLATRVNVEIDFHSEMMTSMQAQKETGQKTDLVDAQAAAIMLQSYIESNKK